MKRFRSLKLDGSRVEIVYTERPSGQAGPEIEATFRASEEPRPEMRAGFLALPDPVRELLKLPEGWARDRLSVGKIVWSWSENAGVAGAVMCCRADLDCARGPLTFNTPHLPFEPYSEGGQEPTMPSEIVAILEDLEDEAWRYLRGERAQGELFEGKAP